MDYLSYPRVTQILQATEDEEKTLKLLKWRKKMEKIHGIEGAERERNKILQHGTDTHTAIEKYLVDDPYDGHIDISRLYYLLDFIKKESDSLIIENRMYSHNYKFQGKPDLICEYRGQTTIFDWTTSHSLKKRAWIEHKFFQAGAYSLLALEERQIEVEQLGVVVIVPGTKPQVFFTDPDDDDESLDFYQQSFLERLFEYKRMQKIAQ